MSFDVKRSGIIFTAAVFGAVLVGYLVERRRREDSSSPFTFSAPLVSPDFEPLEPPLGQNRLSGRIVHADGTPASDVQVFLYRVEPIPGIAEPLSWTISDADGRFQLEGLVQARFEAALVRSGHPPLTQEIELPAAEELIWVLPPPLEPLPVLPEISRAPLGGRIQPPPGRTTDEWPLVGYEVVLVPVPDAYSLSGATFRRTLTDRDGEFRFEEVVRAPYRVEILPPWAAGGSWPVVAAIDLDTQQPRSEEEELALSLFSGGIEGRLADLEGHPVEGALVKVWPADQPTRIWPPLETDASGGFRVLDLPPGNYVVRLRAGAAARERELEVQSGEVSTAVFEPIEPPATTEERSR